MVDVSFLLKTFYERVVSVHPTTHRLSPMLSLFERPDDVDVMRYCDLGLANQRVIEAKIFVFFALNVGSKWLGRHLSVLYASVWDRNG